MASLKTRYRGRPEFSGGAQSQSAPSVMSTPVQARVTPVSDAAPVAPEDFTNPVELAEKAAIKERLEAQQQADHFHQQQPQQPQFATEPPEPADPVEQSIAALQAPENFKGWLRGHPQLMTEPRLRAALEHHHFAAFDQAGGEFNNKYFDVLERLLGLRMAPVSQPVASAMAARQAPNVSAPPSRESVSWTNGRPVHAGALPALTTEEAEFAVSLGMTHRQYQVQKAKMHQLKPELAPR